MVFSYATSDFVISGSRHPEGSTIFDSASSRASVHGTAVGIPTTAQPAAASATVLIR
ncbi:Uncharacterised protein [Mycobacteroides abscessus subsp. abscessus]|nr:Uncharacterised protein [Mycobacteroides abscessus subsp. abscessus]